MQRAPPPPPAAAWRFISSSQDSACGIYKKERDTTLKKKRKRPTLAGRAGARLAGSLTRAVLGSLAESRLDHREGAAGDNLPKSETSNISVPLR